MSGNAWQWLGRFANRPELLLADEPTGNLDAKSAAKLLEYVAEYNAAGGTVLLVTHDQRAAGYARRTVVLESGELQPETEEVAL